MPVSKAVYEREKNRADRLEQEIRQLNEAIRNDYIKALSDSSRALSSAMATIASMRQVNHDR